MKGLVAGAYGEFSTDLNALVKDMPRLKLGVELDQDRAGVAVVMGLVRTKLGVAAVRAQAGLLLDGLRWVGPGGAAAYANRKEARQADERLVAEASAVWASHYEVCVSRAFNLFGAGGPVSGAFASPR